MSVQEERTLDVPLLRFVLGVPVIFLGFGILAPAVYSVIWSFFGTDVVGILDQTATVKWYQDILADEKWVAAILTSLLFSLMTAISATIAAAIIGFAGRIGSNNVRSAYAFLAMTMSALPMLIYAMGLRILFNGVPLGSLVALFIGYNVAVFPYVYFPVAARSEGVPKQALWSSLTLGASPLSTLRKVYSPIVEGGLWLAAAIAMLLAWDELVMPLVLIDGAQTTVSKRLWDLVGTLVDPSPAVISTLTFGVAGIVAGCLWFIAAVRRRLP